MSDETTRRPSKGRRRGRPQHRSGRWGPFEYQALRRAWSSCALRAKPHSTPQPIRFLHSFVHHLPDMRLLRSSSASYSVAGRVSAFGSLTPGRSRLGFGNDWREFWTGASVRRSLRLTVMTPRPGGRRANHRLGAGAGGRRFGFRWTFCSCAVSSKSLSAHRTRVRTRG
jgi:hypothetical protein